MVVPAVVSAVLGSGDVLLMDEDVEGLEVVLAGVVDRVGVRGEVMEPSGTKNPYF